MSTSNWKRRAALALTAGLLAGVFSVSCRRDRVISTAVHHGVGVVESIDKDNSMVQIDHEDIPGYMPAMNMPFHVSTKALLDTVQAGDKVEFTLKDTEKGMVVIEIKKR